MKLPEAAAVVQLMTLAFPNPKLEDESIELWVHEVVRLGDAAAAHEAMTLAIRESHYRPAIADFLNTYREIVKRKVDVQPALERGRPRDMPDWVRVWAWARQNGEQRVFPQQRAEFNVREVERQGGELTDADYEALVVRWEAAGRPHVAYPGIGATA